MARTPKTNTSLTPLVAIDDGYAQTKLFGRHPSGKGYVQKVFRTSVKSGRFAISMAKGTAQDCYEVEEGNAFTISDSIEGESTQFDSFHVSPMNRALVHHALVNGGYQNQAVNLVTGLPVADFFTSDGLNNALIEQKTKNLMRGIKRVSSSEPLASIKDVQVGCQAVAAFVDFIYDDNLKARDGIDIEGRYAIVDIGGRTTDVAVIINGETIDFSMSGTKDLGVLDVYKKLAESIKKTQNIRDDFPFQVLDKAVRTGHIEIWGRQIEIKDIVHSAIDEVADQIKREIERRISSGARMKQVLFVGGGSSLFSQLATNFQNGVLIKDSEFANARGLWKYAALQLKAEGIEP